MLKSMSLGAELKKAIADAGLTQASFARAIGRESGNITLIAKDQRPLPAEWFDDAVNVLGLRQKGRENQYESFVREALLSALPEKYRPHLRKRLHQFDDLETRYYRLLESSRDR